MQQEGWLVALRVRQGGVEAESRGACESVVQRNVLCCAGNRFGAVLMQRATLLGVSALVAI